MSHVQKIKHTFIKYRSFVYQTTLHELVPLYNNKVVLS